MEDNLAQQLAHSLPSALSQLYSTGIMAMAYACFNGDIVDANPAFLKLFGYTAEEVKAGKLNWRSITPGEFIPSNKAIRDLKTHGNSPVLIKEYLHKQGHRIAVLITSTVIKHPQADVVSCLFDVTDQEIIKDQLKLVAAKYRSIWSSSIIGINTWNINGDILDANEAYTHILGYSQEDIRAGKVKWSELIEPGHIKHTEGLVMALQGKPVVPYETRHRHKDGSYRTIMIGYEMLPGSVTEGIAIIIDVTEQKKLRDELLKTQERIRKVTEIMVDILTIHDRNFRYVYASPAIEKAVGRPAKDFVGKTVREMGFEDALCTFFETSLAAVVSERRSLMVEYQNAGKHFHSIMTPEFDSNKEIENILVVTRDITLLKQQEQKKDDFISLVGHELKTPVTSLKAIIQLAQRAIRDGRIEESVHFLSKADNQLKKQVSLIDHLMEVSRVDSGKIALDCTTFPLTDLISSCVELISVNHNPDLIDVSCSPAIQLHADWNRVEQVVCNLLSNASRYSSPKSRISINVTAEAQTCLIAITDEGVGIKPEKLPYIFERFYRINDDGHSSSGLGLGLYISAQIVAMHQGRIWAESQQGKGSVFFVELPLNCK